MADSYVPGDEPIPGSGYRLVRFLGRGGFGEVWKATAPGGAEAALKIIKLGGKEGRKEFRALQLVKRIRHPNLVPIIAFWLKDADGSILDDAVAGQQDLALGDVKGTPISETMIVQPQVSSVQASELVIAMGLGDKSLFDRLNECKSQDLDGIPSDELLGYMEDTAEAIDFLNSSAHDLGSGSVAIQHCDIKPHNLMIVGGATQVCDFGLARVLGSDRTTTAAASIAYAAPECLVEGKPSESTDQYCLAVTYYELKTGDLPNRGETLAAIMDAKRCGDLDFSKLPAAEQDVLRRATSQAPSDRYPSTLEMVRALQRAWAGEEGKPRERRRGYYLLILTMAAAAALVAIGLWRLNRPARELPSDPASVALLQAEELVTQREFDAAIEQFNEVLEIKPEFGMALLGRARAYQKLKRYSEAITDFEALDPQKFDIQDDLVEVYMARGNSRRDDRLFDDAMADYGKVLGIEPSHQRARLELARCHLELKQYERVIAELERAPKLLDDRTIGSLVDFAVAYYQQGLSRGNEDFEAALAAFEMAIRLDQDGKVGTDSRNACADGYLNRGTDFLRNGDFRRAIEDFNEASSYAPDDFRIFSRRGFAHSALTEWESAVKDFTEALNIDPNDVDYLNRGRAYLQLGEDGKARAMDDFTDAIRMNSENADAYVFRGGIQEDLDMAIADFSAAVEIYAKNPDHSLSLANAYAGRAATFLDAGKLDQAGNDLDAVIEIGDREVLRSIHDLFDFLATQYFEVGNAAKAVYWAKKAVEWAPDEDTETKTQYEQQLRQYEAAADRDSG